MEKSLKTETSAGCKNSRIHHEMTNILKKELIPSLGCTEPIAIAYTAALAANALNVSYFDGEIQKLVVKVSKNIFKNVKDVRIPGAGDFYGAEAAAVLGAFFGDCEKRLEVIEGISASDVEKCKKFIKAGKAEAQMLETDELFDIVVRVYSKNHTA